MCVLGCIFEVCLGVFLGFVWVRFGRRVFGVCFECVFECVFGCVLVCLGV